MKRLIFFIILVIVPISMMITSCSKAQQAANELANPVGIVTTIAGPSFQVMNAVGTAASFNIPTGVAVDAAGNVYVADQVNNMIRKISPSGGVSTLAGSGQKGSSNGAGNAASFYFPTGVAVDAKGNVYVADDLNNMIRMVSPLGVVTTLAGNGSIGSTNGTGTAASFSGPTGLAVDAVGNIYVADGGNNMIRMISQAGVVTTFAGSGFTGSANGTGTAALFHLPTGVAVDPEGNVYVADFGNNLIRIISSLGVVTTLAGDGYVGHRNGQGTNAMFDDPYGIAVDKEGNVFVGEIGNQDIRLINSSGLVSTLAGNGTVGSINGQGTVANFWFPEGVAVDASENVYVADASNNLIRKISSSAVVSTLAGNGTAGDANTTASFNSPCGVAVNAQGYVYVADVSNNMIRTISPSGVVGTLAGTGSMGSSNGIPLVATFNNPYGVAVDAAENVYVADLGNILIRQIPSFGEVSTLAGNGTTGSTNGTGTAASFNLPFGVAVDAAENVYVADYGNNLIRKISPTGVVSTLAGSGTSGSTNGMGSAASFNGPIGVAVDAAGNVYVADEMNNLIRKISPSGVVTTLAGNGTSGSSNGTGAYVSFSLPHGVAVDGSGNVYVSDYGNNMIRRISSSGVVTTWAGNGTAGSSNGGGYAASFNQPWGIAVDATGNLYVADSRNNLIRKITAD